MKEVALFIISNISRDISSPESLIPQGYFITNKTDYEIMYINNCPFCATELKNKKK